MPTKAFGMIIAALTGTENRLQGSGAPVFPEKIGYGRKVSGFGL